MRLNFRVLHLPYFLTTSYSPTQNGIENFKFTLMLAKQVEVQCLHSNIVASFDLFVLLLKHLLPRNRCLPTALQELFAVKWALEQFRNYLIGQKFRVITDHTNLKFLASIAPQNSKLAKWCFSLAEFDLSIEHRPGKTNVVPDALSRAPLPTPHREAHILVFPPSQVSSCLLTALGFNRCLQNTAPELQPFNSPLTCPNLACSAQTPLHATALNEQAEGCHYVAVQALHHNLLC